MAVNKKDVKAPVFFLNSFGGLSTDTCNLDGTWKSAAADIRIILVRAPILYAVLFCFFML